jgi:hypothetical protein
LRKEKKRKVWREEEKLITAAATDAAFRAAIIKNATTHAM